MIQKTLALGTAAIFLAGAAFAGPGKDKGKKPAPKKEKQVVINVCPMTGEDSKSGAGGSEVVGKYKVNFCCAGCKPNFDKLSKAEKEKKLADLAKKQEGAKKS